MKKNSATKRIVVTLVAAVLLLSAAAGAIPLAKALYPQDYSEYVEYYAQKYSLEPSMVYAIIRTESRFNPDANSGDADARGLMQITEQTFAWIKSLIAPTESITFDELYDPEQSVRFGCFMLAYCMKLYDNDIATTAAAYHNGINLVNRLIADGKYSADGKTLNSFPYKQMNIYVRRVTSAYDIYTKLY
ncbi:MAG: lytic transglycosylase domain-containing protein [Clostridia bacterium]|nr:lytic transglycosylase domain-containing protein [Clostridia bacterium]